MVQSGQICITAFISPYTADRENVKALYEKDGMCIQEVYLSTPLEECEKRDVKGLYKKAREGIIKQFTGISDPYEAPEHPDLNLPTVGESPQESAERILIHLKKIGVLADKEECKFDPINLYDLSEELRKEAESLPKIQISRDSIETLQVLAEGWAQPLDNFMNEKQLLEVIHMKTLTIDNQRTIFSVPLTCHVSDADYQRCKDEKAITLVNDKDEILAVIRDP